MKAVSAVCFKSALAFSFMLLSSSVAMAQGNCSEISNDVSVAVSKDPSKVLMVVEDALVINEGCAGEIVRAAIVASKADNALAGQIVQTAISVSPKMTVAINEAAASVAPGLALAPPPVEESLRPVAVGDDKNPGDSKNPGKNPVVVETVAVEDDFFIPASIRGIYLIQPPASGPLPCDDIKRCNCTPVSPAAAIP